jgi:hypothetical protein
LRLPLLGLEAIMGSASIALTALLVVFES